MLKFKTTRQYVEQDSRPLKLGYCSFEELLKFRSPCAYTSGQYGWNADIFQFCDIIATNVTFVIGYRPFGADVDYKTVEHYEELARVINKYYYDRRQDIVNRNHNIEALNRLIRAFITDATINKNGYFYTYRDATDFFLRNPDLCYEED